MQVLKTYFADGYMPRLFLKIHIGVCFIRVVSCICSETENCDQGHLSRGLVEVYRVGGILCGLGFVKYEAEYLHTQQYYHCAEMI